MTFRCDICKDTGIIILDSERAMQCKCVLENAKKKRIEKALNFANIPLDFKDLKIRDFRTDIYEKQDSKTLAENAKTIAIKYITNFDKLEILGKGLYLYSNIPGSGKTRMAISIGNALIQQHDKSVKYMTVKEFLTEVQSSFKDSENNIKDLQKAAREVDILILDDLGVENRTTWSESMLYEMLDYRNDSKKVTIFTANLSIDDLDYHERVKSRIKRMSTVVKFPEESVRDKIGNSEDEEFLKILFE